MMDENQYVITRLKNFVRKFMPTNTAVWLYGSRARGDNRTDSDWDIVIILDKEKANAEDFNSLAFPICMFGVDLKQVFIPQIYGKQEWENMSISPYCQNVMKDKLVIL